MPQALSTVATICALVLAGWALLASALNRPPDSAQFIGTILTSVVVAVLIVASVANWGPKEPVTFIGYSMTALLLPPGAWVVARLEPTRWGSLIVGVSALIVPVLVLRMGQVWGVS
ncbi:MAG TPA: hypothetical protein DGG94_23515 [Micromonosporaceae bacterium]|nr:hypothetical protein [Micromonosporaceae bacterium]HCU52719.1 hypothetical protein [Micromonosporaceae bacterium]